MKQILVAITVLLSTSLQAKVVQIASEADYRKHYSGKKPVVTMYTADYCGPCRQTKPHFTRAAQTFGDVTFCMVDIGNKALKGITKGIRSIPTMVFSRNGKTIMRESGGLSSRQLNNSIQKFRRRLRPKRVTKIIKK